MKDISISSICTILFNLLIVHYLSAEIIYVDNNLSKNITNGRYSVANRNNTGRDGNAYCTIQDAIIAVSQGDTIYMRGGTYSEKVAFPANKKGTEKNWNLLQSFPGEWAIIDGSQAQPLGNHAVIRFKDGDHSICPQYWIFRCFEVTGGGKGSPVYGTGGGFMFDTGYNLIFEYLYIHDNDGFEGTNDAGIAIKNEYQAAQNITIRYCYFKNNSCSGGNGNCANISFFSDYVYIPDRVDIANARKNNEVCYNYIEGSDMGIKNKAPQYLCLDVSGADSLRYRDLGDRYHHNIIKNFYDQGIAARQDFIQVYNNIVHSEVTRNGGISLGSSHYDSDREPFHACVYNNHLIGKGCDLRVEHTDNMVYSPPLHPYAHIYNNILENIGPEHNGYNDLNIYHTWTSYRGTDIDLSRIFVENNLFIPRTNFDIVINLGPVRNDYTAANWLSAGFSRVLYAAGSSEEFHKNGDIYKNNGNFSLGNGKNIANGGLGISHPYLKDVFIPSYIGPADPENDGWIDGVLNDITNVEWLKNQFSGMPPEWSVSTKKCK
jgi:hypothetical protein